MGEIVGIWVKNGVIGGTSGAVFRPFRGPHGSIDSGGRKEVGNGG